ncbi:MAG: four helix bundle protein [Prolixibacteraceae bacterium]|nr:four helix bundle protein [Prolixibacteraceae bacterium]
MSYKKLEIWQLAKEIAIEVHKMTITELPKFEMFETGQQIRRSAKSTRTNIVEGYGRKRYQAEYYKFLIYSWVQTMKQLIIWKNYGKQVR